MTRYTKDAPGQSKEPFGNAGICTHCGYCLPVCPTYQALNDESDSPRGRVSVVLALARGDLTPAQAESALSRCLLCRACHAACPAGVRPAKLALQFRNLHPIPPTRFARLFHRITDSEPLTALAARWLMRHQDSGLQARLRRWGLPARLFPALTRLEGLLPEARPLEPVPPFPLPTPARPGEKRQRVALLCGCMARLFHPRTGPATANLLALARAEVVAMRGFGCCGAPYRESGDRAALLRQARRTLGAYREAGVVDAVICDSAICAVTVQGYPRLLADDHDLADTAREFSEKTVDLTRFLQQHLPLSELPVTDPGLGRLAYQDHCQTRFGLGIMESPRALLDALPVERTEIGEPGSNGMCCGAGGIYQLHHPGISQAVRTMKLQAVEASGAGCVVSTNPGCILHLEAGLRETGSLVRVRHLAELLWTALTPNTSDRK